MSSGNSEKPGGSYPPEVEGREGGRQGGRGPAPGSAWVKFRANQVVGGCAIGIFSAVPPEYAKKENEGEEGEGRKAETRARKYGDLEWNVDGAPPPDFCVVEDELGPSYRAELCVFYRLAEAQMRDVRVRGPRRPTVLQARKDGCELRREAFRSGPDDPTLQKVRDRLHVLEATEWTAADLVGEDVVPEAEQRLPAFTTATQAEKFKEEEQGVATFREWIYSKKEDVSVNYQPSGPNWSPAAQALPTPRVSGIWFVHERQNENGKHIPWLFFNASTGKYFRHRGDVGRWIQTGTPNEPVVHPVTISHGSTCCPAAGCRKDALAVALPELARTGAALKQPLPFLDKPAALYLLADGLRGSNVAAEFYAKRFHSHFLPRLSSRPTDLQDFELAALVQEAVEMTDNALVESNARYAGCGFALALILGRRLVVGAVGRCRVVLSRPATQEPDRGGDSTGHASGSSAEWHGQALAGGPDTRLPLLAEAERRRLQSAYAPLDLASTALLRSYSSSAEELSAITNEQDRLLARVAHAAHPFAALGLTLADIQSGFAAVRKAVENFESTAHPSKVYPKVDATLSEVASAAHARVIEAAAVVEAMLGLDYFGTQLLAELFNLMDEERGIPSTKKAAAVLGVEPGCSKENVQLAIERRFRAPIQQLLAASPELVSRGFCILGELAEAATRSANLWAPEDRSVRLTRAMGFRDLKTPRRLLGCEVAFAVRRLEPGTLGLSLLSGAARSLSEARVAQIAQRHNGRPRAACVRTATEAAAAAPDEAVGAVTLYINIASETQAEPAPTPADASKGPEPKRRKTDSSSFETSDGKPKRVRVGHVLLKIPGVGEHDSQARRPAKVGRTQLDAERQLMDLLETLYQLDEKRLPARFAAACREMSDCKTALNAPNADCGWVPPGQLGKEFDSVAFELPVGGLSDIVVTPRGVHVIYRYA